MNECTTVKHIRMETDINQLNNGDYCQVIGGVHKGKSGIVQDLHTSKTGHLTLTVLQDNGVRCKTLGRNVVKSPHK